MNAVKKGNLDQMALLFERHNRNLFGFFFNLTSDAPQSEDLVQIVFYRMMKYRKNFRGEGSFKTWMFHIARNVWNDWLKKNKRKGRNQNLDEWQHEATDHHTPESNWVAEDEQRILRRAIDQLPKEKKEIIVMSKLQELKYEQIAQILDCSVGNVKVKVFRAMKELKEVFQKMPK